MVDRKVRVVEDCSCPEGQQVVKVRGIQVVEQRAVPSEVEEAPKNQEVEEYREEVE